MSTDKERDLLLKKVQALLNMADPERGGSQTEIEMAAKHAKKIMDEYNISMLEVMQEKKDNPKLFTSDESNYAVAKMKPWHWSLARAICRIVGTKHYSTSSWGKSEREKNNKGRDFKLAKMCFFGMEANVKVACELFDKWCARIDAMATTAVSGYINELTEEFAEEMEEQGLTQVRFVRGLGERHPQTWRTSWLDGCIAGIHQALREEEEKQEDADRVAQGKIPFSAMSYEEARKVRRAEAVEANWLEVSGQLAPVTSSSTALALYVKEVETAYDNFSKGFRRVNSHTSGNSNYGAYASGHAVGKGIRLNSKELKG